MATTNSSLKQNQAGVIHHLGLILLFIAVIGVIGGVGFRVYQTNQGEATTVVAEESIVDEEEDADGEVLPPADTEKEEAADVEGENSAGSGS